MATCKEIVQVQNEECRKQINELVAMKMAKGGNADVIKKLNKIGSQVYSPQMQLLPVVADDLNAAITAAFAAQVQSYEENKGKPRIVTGLLK